MTDVFHLGAILIEISQILKKMRRIVEPWLRFFSKTICAIIKTRCTDLCSINAIRVGSYYLNLLICWIFIKQLFLKLRSKKILRVKVIRRNHFNDQIEISRFLMIFASYNTVVGTGRWPSCWLSTLHDYST